MLVAYKALLSLTAQPNYMFDQMSTRKMAASCGFLTANPLIIEEDLQTILDSPEPRGIPFL